MLPVQIEMGAGGSGRVGAGSGGVGQGFVPGFPLQVKIILISCTFLENFQKSYVGLAAWKIDVVLFRESWIGQGWLRTVQ